jgi:hypothetical protein
MACIECVICFEPIDGNDRVTFARCLHGNRVHSQCIMRWTDTCPLCRTVIYDNNHTIRNLIHDINNRNHRRNISLV